VFITGSPCNGNAEQVPASWRARIWDGLQGAKRRHAGWHGEHLQRGRPPESADARGATIREDHPYVRGPKMLAFLVLCVVLAISATYELIEWAAAVLLGQGADEFLGTQGDPWDTQSDMAFAGLGALVALALFSRVQDRQIARLRADGLAAEPSALP
jgi:uncharacterized membrane protein YjdF